MILNASSRSSWWYCVLLVSLVLGLVLLPALAGYPLDQTELLNELSAISSELDESASYIEQGLNKVENSLNQQDERLQRLEQNFDERLQRVELKLEKANQELTISEQDSKEFEKQVSALSVSFNDYKKKKDRESKLLKLGLGAALFAIVVESIALAIK